MRVNANGTVDFSAMVDMTRLQNFATASGVPNSTKGMALKYIGALGNSFPISASGTLSITNNQVNANFTNLYRYG